MGRPAWHKISRIKQKSWGVKKLINFALDKHYFGFYVTFTDSAEGLSDYFDFDRAETVGGSTYIHLIEKNIHPQEFTGDRLLSKGFFEEVSDQAKKLGRDYAYIFDSLNRKNFTFLTPLNCDLKAFIFALNDSAEAFVLLLSK